MTSIIPCNMTRNLYDDIISNILSWLPGTQVMNILLPNDRLMYAQLQMNSDLVKTSVRLGWCIMKLNNNIVPMDMFNNIQLVLLHKLGKVSTRDIAIILPNIHGYVKTLSCVDMFKHQISLKKICKYYTDDDIKLAMKEDDVLYYIGTRYTELCKRLQYKVPKEQVDRINDLKNYKYIYRLIVQDDILVGYNTHWENGRRTIWTENFKKYPHDNLMELLRYDEGNFLTYMCDYITINEDIDSKEADKIIIKSINERPTLLPHYMQFYSYDKLNHERCKYQPKYINYLMDNKLFDRVDINDKKVVTALIKHKYRMYVPTTIHGFLDEYAFDILLALLNVDKDSKIRIFDGSSLTTISHGDILNYVFHTDSIIDICKRYKFSPYLIYTLVTSIYSMVSEEQVLSLIEYVSGCPEVLYMMYMYFHKSTREDTIVLIIYDYIIDMLITYYRSWFNKKRTCSAEM